METDTKARRRRRRRNKKKKQKDLLTKIEKKDLLPFLLRSGRGPHRDKTKYTRKRRHKEDLLEEEN